MVLAELNRQAEYYQAMRQAFASVQGRADSGIAADVTRRMGQAVRRRRALPRSGSGLLRADLAAEPEP